MVMAEIDDDEGWDTVEEWTSDSGGSAMMK